VKPPICKNPDHPPDAPRDKMLLVDEHRTQGHVTHYVFACVPCKDIRKLISAQVVTAPEFRQYVATEPRMLAYKRARLVERDPTRGRIKYFE